MVDGYLLGIDIGTYESKAVLVTSVGEVTNSLPRITNYNRNAARHA